MVCCEFNVMASFLQNSLPATYMIAVSFYVIGMMYVAGNISFDPHGYKVTRHLSLNLS
jgi:hypothetical protein